MTSVIALGRRSGGAVDRRRAGSFIVLACAVLLLVVVGPVTRRAQAAEPPDQLRAGAAEVDATWHVGASAGQYSDTPTDPQQAIQSEWDPNLQHVAKNPGYGVASRLTVSAVVLQSGSGQPVALVKQDLYLAQDLLTRRVGQLLSAHGSNVTYDHVLLSATHDHSSPYYSTPAAGVWIFQDVFDLRNFEYQARAIASAIEQAEDAMRPATIGATTIQQPFVQTNIVGPSTGDDGSPAGYPRDENDHGLVVMRIDGTDGVPIATYVNYAQHPEGLDGYDLTSEDYLAPLRRYVERATGAPLVFSQSAVGSSEGPYEGYYPRGQHPLYPDGSSAGVVKAFAHVGHAQVERGARILADSVLQAWTAIGAHDPNVQIPVSGDVPVAMLTQWVPGPVSHPYPSVGNCRMVTTVDGDPGAGVAPDCERAGTGIHTGLYESLVDAGLPIPDGYGAGAFHLVEENARIKLQAVRIGEILLASCSCEAQVDLIKNLESRLDDVVGNQYWGYDYPCVPDGAAWRCTQVKVDEPGGQKVFSISDAVYRRMRAQVRNDAAGWNDPANLLAAQSEPSDPAKIWGNFTHTELPADKGFHLVVGLGHTGDYDGYIVSYREYQNRESYRKALTSYGPHSADYMNTHLLDVARFLRDGTALPTVPNQAQADADEVRQEAEARTLGALSAFYYDGWDATRPDDIGPVEGVEQPAPTVERFGAATFTWRGGSNWVDNPDAKVERLVGGQWVPHADMTGEVVTSLTTPPGVESIAKEVPGQEWLWTATFEAFDAWPRADVDGGQVPNGTYRFAVDGNHRAGATEAYHLTSEPFQVAPWEGIHAADPVALAGGAVRVGVDPIVYPRTYEPHPSLRLIRDDGGDPVPPSASASLFCRTCSFRPWARSGQVASVSLTVATAGGEVRRRVPASFDGTGWVAQVDLQPGELAFVTRAGVADAFGEINGEPTMALDASGALVPAPDLEVTPVVPELPVTGFLPVLMVVLIGAATFVLRRRRHV
jgi:hypothetical protein